MIVEEIVQSVIRRKLIILSSDYLLIMRTLNFPQTDKEEDNVLL